MSFVVKRKIVEEIDEIGIGYERLIKHPDYTDVFYSEDQHCPSCGTTILKRVDTPAGARFDCALCQLGLECWSVRERHIEA